VTYGDIADALGDKVASRAIGRLMAQNKYPNKIPCFKVIHSDGKIGKYSLGGEGEKIKRLVREGIEVINNRVNLEKYKEDIRNLEIYPVLKELKLIQSYLSKTLSIKSVDISSIRYIISTDVTYVDWYPEIGIASAVLFDRVNDEKILGISISIMPIYFPYIPGYLAFRELPIILSAIDSLLFHIRVKPDLYIFDGHGTLHPRTFGIASHAGAILNAPTIGVAKKLLVGKIENRISRIDKFMISKVVVKEPIGWGYKVWVRGHEKKAIYVSPGNLIGHEDSLKMILSLKWRETKLLVTDFPHRIVGDFRKKIKSLLPDMFV